jgi:hypothetical protein
MTTATGIDPSPLRPSTPPRTRRRIAVRVAFALWVVMCTVLGGYLLSAHLLTLPTPEITDLGPQRSAIAARQSTQQGRWLAVHVLDQECTCSLRVLDHLLTAPRPSGLVERIVLIASDVGPIRQAVIRARGYDLDVVTPEDLAARYRVQAAPLLIIIDPADNVSYVGGYTPRKQADDIRDGALIAALRRGEHVTPLPTFGCAVGRALRAKIDPLGIRNWK